jgi:hypothetical protein
MTDPVAAPIGGAVRIGPFTDASLRGVADAASS